MNCLFMHFTYRPRTLYLEIYMICANLMLVYETHTLITGFCNYMCVKGKFFFWFSSISHALWTMLKCIPSCIIRMTVLHS